MLADKRLLLLNGPNLNMLGRRDPSLYGSFTLAEAVAAARQEAEAQGYELEARQSNYEGELVSWIQEAVDCFAALMINPGALTHYSYALADALELFHGKKVELHISDIHQREAFRQVSVTRAACDGQIAGFGKNSYVYGVRQAIALLEGWQKPSHEGRTDERFQVQEDEESETK